MTSWYDNDFISGPNTVDLHRIRSHIEILRYCKRKAAEIKALEASTRAVIEESLGDNEIGTLDGQPAVRWTFVKTNRLNQRKLKEDKPDLVAEYTEASESRRFDVQ